VRGGERSGREKPAREAGERSGRENRSRGQSERARLKRERD
jgi:hypothetical protein